MNYDFRIEYDKEQDLFKHIASIKNKQDGS